MSLGINRHLNNETILSFHPVFGLFDRHPHRNEKH